MKKTWVVLSALLVAMIFAGCSSERYVERIVIDNPTDFIANVDVTGGARDGWLGIATADAHSAKTVEQVYDQGSTWIFRFSYSGHEEEIQISRAELARSDWRVQVPDSFASALRARGVPPPP